MEFYLDPRRLEEHNEHIREQLRHVRRFSRLVAQSKEYDTMHQEELNRIQQRLERVERNLSQLITATDDALVEYAALERETRDKMAQLRHDASGLFL
ncbi:MAG: hypothetical protein MR452_07970 [Faecalibacterium prausnitzii]|jgi:DNA repair ATPase RecN|nr:hypothetical protein [Faecalibacterium prausnitzii]